MEQVWLRKTSELNTRRLPFWEINSFIVYCGGGWGVFVEGGSLCGMFLVSLWFVRRSRIHFSGGPLVLIGN